MGDVPGLFVRVFIFPVVHLVAPVSKQNNSIVLCENKLGQVSCDLFMAFTTVPVAGYQAVTWDGETYP